MISLTIRNKTAPLLWTPYTQPLFCLVILFVSPRYEKNEVSLSVAAYTIILFQMAFLEQICGCLLLVEKNRRLRIAVIVSKNLFTDINKHVHETPTQIISAVQNFFLTRLVIILFHSDILIQHILIKEKSCI